MRARIMQPCDAMHPRRRSIRVLRVVRATRLYTSIPQLSARQLFWNDIDIFFKIINVSTSIIVVELRSRKIEKTIHLSRTRLLYRKLGCWISRVSMVVRWSVILKIRGCVPKFLRNEDLSKTKYFHCQLNFERVYRLYKINNFMMARKVD